MCFYLYHLLLFIDLSDNSTTNRNMFYIFRLETRFRINEHDAYNNGSRSSWVFASRTDYRNLIRAELQPIGEHPYRYIGSQRSEPC